MTAAIAFEDNKQVAAGPLGDVAVAVRRRAGKATHENIQVFDQASGRTLHLDLTGSETEIRARHVQHLPPSGPAPGDTPAPDAPRGPGRPKLGVVAREVTLLPRHWEWLASQPGGASVALRKLVEDARKSRGPSDNLRARQEAAYRFLSAMAGDWQNFEDSTRALFAGDETRFRDLTDSWPTDVRDHARQLAFPAAKT
jgi:hypothetical protein